MSKTEHTGGRVLLARWGEEIVGMVMLELQGEGQCELLKFGVKEAYRGRGIGTALMEAALQAARDAGQKKAAEPGYFLQRGHSVRENWVTSLIHSRERRRYRPMPNLTNCSAMMPT